MSESRITSMSRLDATGESRIRALSAIYRRAIERYEENQTPTEPAQHNDHAAGESKPGVALENST